MESGGAQTPIMIVLAFAAFASLTLNIGKAVMKMKVEVLKKGKLVLSPENRHDFLVWCGGMMMTFVAGILIMKAQDMTDKASLVSSANGVGLVGLAFFSMIVLKERVGVREWGAVLMIIIGTVIVSTFNKAAEGEEILNMTALYWCCGITGVACTVIGLISTKAKFAQAFIYAAIGGVSIGLMNIFYHVGPLVAGSFGASFKTAYPYIGYMLGNVTFVMTNIAFFYGSGIMVVPTLNAIMIISPMIFEYFVFRTQLQPMQYLGALVITVGVILLTAATAANEPPKVKEPKEPAKAAAS